MKILRMRSSCEAWPKSVPSAFGRRGSLVVWSKGPRTYTMGNGKRVLPNLGKVILRGQA